MNSNTKTGKELAADNSPAQELAADGSPAGVEVEAEYVPSEPFDPESISIDPKVVPMDTLLRRLRQGSIRLAPTFQRNYVWDETRSSQLIESLMLKIPLPMFYVAANEDGNWDVVDGLQRLTTIRNFLLGEEKDNKGERLLKEAIPFALTKLEFLGERFNNKKFSRIESDKMNARIVNNIMETEMRFTVINPGTPEEVKRNIFKRINTGGMPLTAQEIRHALYQGHSTDLLQILVESKLFRKAVDFSVDDSRMAGRELILRFLSFMIRERGEYAGDTDKFLSDTMRIINCLPDINQSKISKIFKKNKVPIIKCNSLEDITDKFNTAMKRSFQFFGEYAFRKAVPGMRRTPINKALFELWSNIFVEMSQDDFDILLTRKSSFNENYKKLFMDYYFERAISRDASSIQGPRDRYLKLNNLIQKTLEQ